MVGAAGAWAFVASGSCNGDTRVGREQEGDLIGVEHAALAAGTDREVDGVDTVGHGGVDGGHRVDRVAAVVT